MHNLAIVWRTPEGEKRYVTPAGWPLTKEGRLLAGKLDEDLKKKISALREKLKTQGFFKMRPGLEKYHLLGVVLQELDDLTLLSKCDPDRENIWRALYDYAPDLAPRKLPTSEERAVGKRNFFLNTYRLGKLSEETIEKIGAWSNWHDIYMVFAANPKLWEDWERFLKWILSMSEKEGAVDRGRLRKTLKIVRKVVGKRAKPQRDTTVLTTSELYQLLNVHAKNSGHKTEA